MSGTGRARYDVHNQGEVEEVRHIGGWLHEGGTAYNDTKKRWPRVTELYAASPRHGA